MAVAFSAASVAGDDAGGTTRDSASITVPSGGMAYVLVVSSDNTAVNPSGVVWDPTGANQALTQVGTTIDHTSPNAKASLWRINSPTAGTAVFRATWGSSQGERLVAPLVLTGVDSSTPNGTVTQNTGTNATPVTAAITTSVGQFAAAFAAHLHGSGSALAYNSPTGTERAEGAITGTPYDGAAIQTHVATGTSTSLQWTLSITPSSWAIFGVPINESTGGGNVSITAGLGALTAAGFAPTLAATARIAITSGLGQLAVTGFAPSVSATGGIAITPGLGQLTVTGHQPSQTLTLPSPEPGVLVLTGFAPSLRVGLSVLPAAGALSMAGFAPTVAATAHVAVSTGLGALSVSSTAPTVQVSASGGITTALGELVLGSAAPTLTVSAHQSATTDVGLLELIGFAPSLSQAGGFELTTDLGTLVITGLAPDIRNSGDILPKGGAGWGRGRRKSYVYKGKRYLLTNEELVRLIATDQIDITREDIKVVYKNKKPHKIAKEAFKSLMDTVAKLHTEPVQDSFDDDAEIEEILALL